ncbi:MAG: TspO/MBR family protein [Candidatus Altimarinota bacterium]
MKNTINKTIKLILSFAFPLAVALVGGVFTGASVNGWYQTLVKPDIAPPNWVFGPVWLILYLSIGLATYLFWETGKPSKTTKKSWNKLPGFLFLYLQLIFNLAWSIIFFVLHSPLAALYEIIFLDALVILNIFYFSKINLKSGLILVPYLAWICFATYLNWNFYILNPY